MSIFSISEDEANQARSDLAAAAPPPVPAQPNAGDFHWQELIPGPMGWTQFAYRTGVLDQREMTNIPRRAIATGAAGLTGVAEIFTNLENTALETPSYMVHGDAAQQAGERSVIDPHFGERNAVTQGLEDARQSLLRHRAALMPTYRLSESQQIVSGIGETLIQAVMAPGIAPLTLGSATYESRRADYIAQGMSEDDADALALSEGVRFGAQAVLPMASGGPVLQRALTGAGINLFLGGINRYQTANELRARGYDQLARDYDWKDPKQLTIDAIIGAAFGAMHTPNDHIPPQVLRAALDVNETLNRQTAFGIPENVESQRWASETLLTLEAQAESDMPVIVPERPEGVGFVERFDEDDIEAMASEIERARRQDAPQSLTSFVRSLGGIADDRGDIAGSAGDNQRGFARILRSDGRAADDVALAAWEAGFFPEHAERPSINDLIDALDQDSRNPGSVVADGEQAFAHRNARELIHYYEKAGVDTSLRGAELREAVRQFSRQHAFEEALREEAEAHGIDREEIDSAIDEAKRQSDEALRARGIDPEALYSRRGEEPAAERFHDDRLTAHQNKVAEMWRNGFEAADIADEMNSTAKSVAVTLSQLRRMSRIRRSRGDVRLRPPVTPENVAAVWRLSERGMSQTRIAAKLGIHQTTVSRILRSPRPAEDALYSRSANGGYATADDLRAAASKAFGADLSALEARSKVVIVDSADNLPFNVPRDATAVHYRGKSYFIADRMSAAEFAGKLLHEVGVHDGFEAFLGPKGVAEVNRHIARMVAEGHPLAMEAMQHALATSSIDKLNAEAGAYLVERAQEARERQAANDWEGLSEDERRAATAYLIENHSDMPLVQRILASIRQWLVKTFGDTFGMKLTVDDIRELAITSLRKVAREGEEPQAIWTPRELAYQRMLSRMTPEQFQARFGRMPNDRELDAMGFYSPLREAIRTSKQERASGAQWLATLEKAPGVKREELDYSLLPDFLKAAGKSVSREAILNYVRAHGVRVEETVLGKPGIDPEVQRKLLPLIEEHDRLWGEMRAFEQMGAANLTEENNARLSEVRARLDEIAPELARLQGLEQESLVADQTKWSQYTLPGGENYRELLLRLPLPDRPGFDEYLSNYRQRYPTATTTDAEVRGFHNQGIPLPEAGAATQFARVKSTSDVFRSSHFDQPNILAHVRFKERVDAEGRRTLFIEEVQSDWHQAGRERGYNTGDQKVTLTLLGRPGWRMEFNTAEEAHAYARKEGISGYNLDAGNKVPDAPFKNNAWAALAMKRMIRWAAENGFDQIAWTRGQHQIERFNLEKHLDELHYSKDQNGDWWLSARDPNGGHIFDGKQVSDADLNATVGVDIAGRMRRGDGRASDIEAGAFILSGDDLRVGGEGMRAFYDRILPNIANDIGKKYGARAGEAQIDVPRVSEDTPLEVKDKDGNVVARYQDENAAADHAKRIGGTYDFPPTPRDTVHSLPITPELRAAAMEGMPLFSFAGRRAATANGDRLRLARLLDREGKDEWFIWHNTGWAKGTDGKWRFEIPDDGAAWAKSWNTLRRRTGEMPLEEAFSHPELFAAYPILRDIRVRFVDEGGGSWYSDKGLIEIGRGGGAESARSTMLHEIQHAIQDIEGFATGTAPGFAGRRAVEAARKDTVNRIRGYHWMSEAGREKLIAEFDARHEAYLNAAGEAEARAVENRSRQDLSGMPPAEATRNAVTNPALLWNPRRRNWETFGQRSVGQNGENGVRSSDGPSRDPIEAPDYQERVGRIQESLKQTDARAEGGARGGQSDRAGVRDGDKPDSALGAQAREILSVSGIRLTPIKDGMFGSLRAQIDTPFDLPPRLRDALEAHKGDRVNNATIDFDAVVNGKNLADPKAREGRRDGVYIRWTSTPDALRGTGAGIWLYRQVIDWAHRQGLTVYSDVSLTEGSLRQYTHRLPDAGYEVTKISATTTDRFTKTVESVDEVSPIYQVRQSYQESKYDAAPPPRSDYKVGGTTLRERQRALEEARAQREAYDKLPPAEQALADDPEMQFSIGRRDSAGRYGYLPPHEKRLAADAALVEIAKSHGDFWRELVRLNNDPQMNKRPSPDLDAYDIQVWAQWLPEYGIKIPEDVQAALDRYTDAANAFGAYDRPESANANLSRSEELAQQILDILQRNGGEISSADLFKQVNEERGTPASAVEIARIRWGIESDEPQYSMARRPISAREILDRTEAQKDEAREMAKGYEAAARCAARNVAETTTRAAAPISAILLRPSAEASVDAAIGQAVGIVASIPLGATVFPWILDAARRDSPPGSYIDELRMGEVRGHENAARLAMLKAQQAALVDGNLDDLDMPSQPLDAPQSGEPLSSVVAQGRRDVEGPPAPLAPAHGLEPPNETFRLTPEAQNRRNRPMAEAHYTSRTLPSGSDMRTSDIQFDPNPETAPSDRAPLPPAGDNQDIADALADYLRKGGKRQ